MKTKYNKLSVILTFCIVAWTYAQKESKEFFEKNPPHTPPTIFMATANPCFLSVSNQYGDHIGISEDTKQKTKAFIQEALKKVPQIKKEIRQLEIDLMMASTEGRYEDHKKLLHELGEAKIKASLFREDIIKRSRKTFNKEDVDKLDNFIIANKEVFLGLSKL